MQLRTQPTTHLNRSHPPAAPTSYSQNSPSGSEAGRQQPTDPRSAGSNPSPELGVGGAAASRCQPVPTESPGSSDNSGSLLLQRVLALAEQRRLANPESGVCEAHAHHPPWPLPGMHNPSAFPAPPLPHPLSRQGADLSPLPGVAARSGSGDRGPRETDMCPEPRLVMQLLQPYLLQLLAQPSSSGSQPRVTAGPVSHVATTTAPHNRSSSDAELRHAGAEGASPAYRPAVSDAASASLPPRASLASPDATSAPPSAAPTSLVADKAACVAHYRPKLLTQIALVLFGVWLLAYLCLAGGAELWAAMKRTATHLRTLATPAELAPHASAEAVACGEGPENLGGSAGRSCGASPPETPTNNQKSLWAGGYRPASVGDRLGCIDESLLHHDSDSPPGSDGSPGPGVTQGAPLDRARSDSFLSLWAGLPVAPAAPGLLPHLSPSETDLMGDCDGVDMVGREAWRDRGDGCDAGAGGEVGGEAGQVGGARQAGERQRAAPAGFGGDVALALAKLSPSVLKILAAGRTMAGNWGRDDNGRLKRFSQRTTQLLTGLMGGRPTAQAPDSSAAQSPVLETAQQPAAETQVPSQPPVRRPDPRQRLFPMESAPTEGSLVGNGSGSEADLDVGADDSQHRQHPFRGVDGAGVRAGAGEGELVGTGNRASNPPRKASAQQVPVSPFKRVQQAVMGVGTGRGEAAGVSPLLELDADS
ncbi:MAG: hypothetical protein WDW36_000228 [Sanguina aurantia]